MKRHLFLDRDGTIIREEHYLRDPSKVVLENGAAEGLRRFADAGYLLVVVSNQSGIGRRLISEEDVDAVNSRLIELLAAQKVYISSWHHCPHRPDENCTCRKPRLGLFHQAASLRAVDWKRSLMVGDKPSDVEAGLSLGMLSALITTGHGSKHIDWARHNYVRVVDSLNDLADEIL